MSPVDVFGWNWGGRMQLMGLADGVNALEPIVHGVK